MKIRDTGPEPDLGVRCSDLGVHCSDLGAHCSDLGAHFSDLGAHCSDLGAHCSDLGAHCSDRVAGAGEDGLVQRVLPGQPQAYRVHRAIGNPLTHIITDPITNRVHRATVWPPLHRPPSPSISKRKIGKVNRLHNRIEPFPALFWALGYSREGQFFRI